MDRLRVGQELDLKLLLHELTLDILIACLFGASNEADAGRLRRGITGWIDRVLSPEAFLAGIAFGPQRVRRFLERSTERGGKSSFSPFEQLPWNRAGRAKADAVDLLRSEVRRCQQHGAGGRTDVLATVATARYEDGAPIEVDHAVDELFTMLVGGHETTANTLAWALRHILASREVRGRIDAEIASLFGDAEPDPTRASDLTYLDACLQESMRRTPIAPAVSRNLLKPLTLEPWTIPAGGIVFPSIYLTHHKRELWSEPYAFRPERFLEPGGVPKEQFFPFGGGRRTCIGMAFAYFEMRIVLLRMFTRVELELRTTSLQSVFRGMTAVPKECRAVVRSTRPAR
jgi:cytochrome P450